MATIPDPLTINVQTNLLPERTFPANLERFSSQMEVYASDVERGTFTGIASVTGNLIKPQPPSNIATFFMPGCWHKTLNENANKIKVYKEHQVLIGRMISGVELPEGKLQFSGKISATTDGNDTLELMRDRALTELSVAWVAKQFEIVSGKDLLERLNTMRLRMEIATRIRENVEEFGLQERYRLVYQARLYHVGVVEEGADDMTDITEVHKKADSTNESVTNTIVEKNSAISAVDVAEQMLSMAQLLVQILQPADPGKYDAMPESDRPYAMMSDAYIQMTQARYVCSVMATMADMPAGMADQMSASPSGVETHEGRVLSAKNLSTIKTSHGALISVASAVAEAIATLKGLLDSAEPPEAESSPVLPERPQANPSASLIERRKQIRSAHIQRALLLNQEMQNGNSNSKGAPATSR